MAENGIAAKALDHFLTKVVFAEDALANHATDDPFAGVDLTVAATPPGAGGLLFLPWLTGTVAPDGNPRARGAFVNIGLETARAHMVRAILEGVAFSQRWLLPPVEALTGETFATVRFSGGGARSDAWAQIFADVLDRPVLPLADPAHSNNRAAALLALDSLGIVSVEEVDRFCPVRGRFEPQPQHRVMYDELFAQFHATYEGLRPVFDALNDR
jgi:xylulokinase